MAKSRQRLIHLSCLDRFVQIAVTNYWLANLHCFSSSHWSWAHEDERSKVKEACHLLKNSSFFKEGRNVIIDGGRLFKNLELYFRIDYFKF